MKNTGKATPRTDFGPIRDRVYLHLFPSFTMKIFGILIGVIILLWLIFVLFRPKSPRRFAEDIAKIQLKALFAYAEKYKNLPKEDIYFKTLLSRPSYSASDVENIFQKAKEGGKENITFSRLVLMLVLEEYNRDFPSRRFEDPEIRRELIMGFCEGVDSVIPSEEVLSNLLQQKHIV